MCGIAGVFGEHADKQLVQRMLEPIRHRGRDDQGIYADKGIALGCNRLSIIDVPGGHQPISNREGTVWVALNGEIYNHNEIREELRTLGHEFKTRSDTEVVAQLYEQWGADCFSRLNGMFSVAVWDSNKRTLHLARDRVGIKPLYYARSDKTLLFASEVKAVLSAALLKKITINRSIVDQLLEVGYPLIPETLLNEVHQIPPAHRMQFQENGSELARFWVPPQIQESAPDIQMLRRTIQHSVVHQTVTSDVPVGAFLSGGLDTSAVVAFASRVRADGLKTFCMGFNEATDEFKDARVVAEAFGTDHHEIMVDASDAMKIFPLMVWHSELPKVNLYSWFVNEAASKYVKVCLSGLGGDELFGGYANTSRFHHAKRIARYRRLGSILAATKATRLLPDRYAKLAKSLRSESLAYSTLITGFPSDDVSSNVKEHVVRYFEGRHGFEQEMVRAEFHTKLPYDYLLVEDSMSMAHTLEVRVPLLDDDLLELMLPIPHRLNVSGSEGKQLLRKAVGDVLPARCLEKPKWGFSVDVFSWWKRSVRDYALKRIPDSKFLRETAPRWHDKVSAKVASPPDEEDTRWYSMAWIMLGLDVWASMFLAEQTPRSVSW